VDPGVVIAVDIRWSFLCRMVINSWKFLLGICCHCDVIFQERAYKSSWFLRCGFAW